MVSEDRSMDDLIAGVFFEISERTKDHIANYDPILDHEVNPFHKHAVKKAREYQGKRIVSLDMDCADCDQGKVVDLSLGFRDITVQLFDTMMFYKDIPIRPCFIRELVDEGTYLKLVREDEKELLLFNEDHGDFSIIYSQMAITKTMNK